MSATAGHVLDRLADGRVHSGQRLADDCGISRAAVAKQVARLRAAGWPIVARRGHGYRLRPSAAPLRREALAAGLAPVADRVTTLDVLEQVDSTSSWLERAGVPDGGRVRICIAEQQTAGRGRRGRRWYAGPGVAATFSLGRCFDRSPSDLLGLSLVVGVALADVLSGEGIPGIRLKWPNDVVVQGAKLAGILVELSGESAGPARAIVGVGLNHDLGESAAAVGQPATDVVRLLDPAPDRSALAGRCMASLVGALDRFERAGFAPLQDAWRQYDALAGQAVRVDTGGRAIDGIAEGIDPSGALVVQTPGGRRRFLSGEVSVRAR